MAKLYRKMRLVTINTCVKMNALSAETLIGGNVFLVPCSLHVQCSAQELQDCDCVDKGVCVQEGDLVRKGVRKEETLRTFLRTRA